MSMVEELVREARPGEETGVTCGCALLGELHELGVLVGPCTEPPAAGVPACGWCIDHTCRDYAEHLRETSGVLATLKPAVRRRIRGVTIDGEQHPGTASRGEADVIAFGK